MKKQPFVPDLSIFDRPRVCSVASFVSSCLSDDDKATFEAALDSKYSSHVIWLWLVDHDFSLTMQQVYRHRTGRCCCRSRHIQKRAS